MQHTLIALLQDRPGVLNRAVSLFRRRGFNIASLSVGHSEAPGVSRMTLVVDREHVEQLVKQLDRLIEVLAVHDVTHERSVELEMCLVKVMASHPHLAELVSIASEWRARIVDVSGAVVILVLTDEPTRVAAFVERVRPFGILELIRSGLIAMALDARTTGGAVRCLEPNEARGSDATSVHARSFRWQADGTSDDEAA